MNLGFQCVVSLRIHHLECGYVYPGKDIWCVSLVHVNSMYESMLLTVFSERFHVLLF